MYTSPNTSVLISFRTWCRSLNPRIRSETERQFELVLLLGIVCAGLAMSRKKYVEALWIFYFAHSALTSARHIPLFLIVASPAIGVE